MNFSTHTCTLTPSLCCTLLACLTGPSQNGADINRPGRSHVSVYTGRPQSSTTRALDSLCTANSHTFHLCFVQKNLGIPRTDMHMHASLQKCSWSHSWWKSQRPGALRLDCSFCSSLILSALPVSLNRFFCICLFFFLLLGLTRVLRFTPTAISSAIWQRSHKPIKPALSPVLQHGRQDSQKL